MNCLGRFLRNLLNINTLWALMILSACVACAVQHFLPTTTTIPASRLHPGPNELTIRLTDHKGTTREQAFSLRYERGSLTVVDTGRTPPSDAPRLLETRAAGSGFILTWDGPAPSRYEVRLGGEPLAAGRLVNLQTLSDAALDYAKAGFDLALGLVATMVLFLGLMRVGQDAGLVPLVARLVRPLVHWLFPQIPRDHPACGAIVMNWAATLMGLGNAATPFGLKAMKELQTLNQHPDVATDAQVMLLGYNTAGFALLPTTLLAMRQSAGCSDPFEVIGTCLVAGAVAMITAIAMVKLLGRLRAFSAPAAKAEAAPPPSAGDTGGPSR